MARHLHLDFETRSDLDLRKVGVEVYAKGRNTDIVCAAYAFGDGPIETWLPYDPLPEEFVDHVESGGTVWAHNSRFEQHLCNEVAIRKYGWPYLYTDQMVCTQAMAYSMALPGSLDGCSAALGVVERKDIEGSRLMMQMCRPREIKPDGTLVWWDEPEKLLRLLEYCKQDVVVERAVGKRMFRLSPFERSVWILDQLINSRGVSVDTPAITTALGIVEVEKIRLNARMQKVSSNRIATCNAVQQIKDFLKAMGVRDVESLSKPDVVDFLATDNLPGVCREVLELRQEAGKASTAKLGPMLVGSGSDGRLRGCFQYRGSNTGRWAGRRVQLQNLKRPSFKQAVIDQVVGGLHRGTFTADDLETFFGPPLSVLSECIRSFITAAPGHELLVCDYASIEARVLAWFAGQESTLEIFRGGGDVYRHAASDIFGISTENVDSTQRQVGKVAVLALGYGGGVGAFQTMAKGYGVKMAPAFEALWSRADKDQRNWGERSYKENKTRFEIEADEYIASELTKVFWREANAHIVDFWHDLESSAIYSVKNPKLKITNKRGNVIFTTNGSFLWCRLPSGGVTCYPYPEVKIVQTPWGAEKPALTYMSEDGPSKKWQRFSTYGGSLAENVTQSLSRDLLADAMIRLESLGYPIVAHVHDEIVCERKTGEGSVEEMADVMSILPDWAADLPISATGWRGFRYRK